MSRRPVSAKLCGALVASLAAAGGSCRGETPAPQAECAILRASLSQSFDPGHGGGSQTLVRRREEDRYEVFREQWKPGELPPTLDSESPPPDLRQRSVLERERAAVERFLARLDRLGARSLTDWRPEVYDLHPVFYEIRLEDACGQSRSFSFTSDPRLSGSRAHARVVRAFREFFAE
jgi:hypothetical protein